MTMEEGSRLEIAVQLLQQHRHLFLQTELSALRLSKLVPLSARSTGEKKVVLEALINECGLEAMALLESAGDHLLEQVGERILAERESEVWLNRCSRCGGLARTGVAQQCRFCGHSWHDTPRFDWYVEQATLNAAKCGDRVVAGHIEGLGLLVCIADGAGNSDAGKDAADLIVTRARAKPWSAETNEWDLQEFLFSCDEAILTIGAESTALVMAFRRNDVCAAAAGDTLLFGQAHGSSWHFPKPRTRRRLGSGNPDVVVCRRPFEGATAAATDGAVACLGIREIGVHLAKGMQPDWLAQRLQSRVADVGDDSSAIVVRKLDR